MDVSVIIVNYKDYGCLHNCIISVMRALQEISGEIIVVDNASVSHEQLVMQKEFPLISWIINHENKGFAKANNQALGTAKGRFFLFLNPDTIVPQHIFETLIPYLDQHAEAGAVGVKMVNGKGDFLPESKRNIPGVRAAFFKMTGFAKLFPNSSFFNAYALGGFSKNGIYKVGALTGAFLLVREEVVHKIGGFDERFFMYGEDIDFCYRMQAGGFEVHYVGTLQITHFKGTSTNKHSTLYRQHFYGSMELFVKKYSPTIYSRTAKWILVLGIRLARCLAAIKSFLLSLR
ncbi:MAG: glycosyltransferase family 2 protein [Sediminibacterium sp.]|jgi:GT2 family glycosyltransferase|nr:glycosyltransferase family 2 protein [Chitinophagaceae bacterium]MCA6448363.1 glycosyltransferase family 2 protein [Chitinophagaceae bacterium]